jgi:hypothetical protein
LEPIRSRIGDYDKWPTRACRPNADRRRDRRDPRQARRDRPGACRAGHRCRRHLCTAKLLAGLAREQPDGSRRRRLRSCDRGPDLGPVRTAATGAANGTEFGFRSCRQCRDRFGGGRGRLGASLSGLAAGEIVDHFGYSATFLTLGAAALVAVIVFFLQMPETAELETIEPETVSPRS